MQVAIEGCCHGELPKIYATIEQAERQSGVKVDLLICCGDFQALRNMDDLHSMAVPPKYRHMGDFYQCARARVGCAGERGFGPSWASTCRYYSGERVAPVLTLFIAGNHEGAHFLWELPHGGW